MTKVRLYRLERDLKAKEIAQDIDVHPSTLCGVETGKVKASNWVRYKLSSFYGVPEQELFKTDSYAI